VIQSVKALSTRRANQERGTPGWHLWQRSYYEHIIRDEEEANRVRAYILANPARWAEDRENPAVQPGLR
jgi:REP element-mobilizing transposase RayT